MWFSHRASVLGALLFLVLSACAVNPVTRQREFNIISEERELTLGRNASAEIAQQFGGVYPDRELQAYVNGVGQRLVQVGDRKDLAYEFQVVDSPIMNAFALPGGFIYITRGLLAELENEAQLASVLGHELGHVCARHSATQLSEALGTQLLSLAALAAPGSREMAMVSATLFQTMMMGYSRAREFQADSMGLKYMYKAGYNPMEVSVFLYDLSKRSQGPAGYSVYNATHPDIFDRVRETRNQAKVMVGMDITQGKLSEKNWTGEAGVTREEIMGHGGNTFADRYKTHLDGLLYGLPQNPHRLRIHTIKPGETIASIAEETLHDRNRAKEIAELNDLEADAPLRPGELLKVVY
jgi:predicted Zn-dependent protease